MSTDEQARKEYAEAGVDLPELAEEEGQEPKEPPAKEEPKAEAPPSKPEESKDDPKEPSQAPRKRSIYEDYKESKNKLKQERELREQREADIAELQNKLDELSKANTTPKESEAKDELTEYAEKIGADPQAIRTLIELARKGMKPELPESVVKDLQEFQQWKAENSKALEQQAFEREFNEALPAIKELFPTANEEELQAIKGEIDKLSHTKEFHDKSLDYVAFKKRNTLNALVSPRKRGPERKGRADTSETEFEFDPNVDISTLSPAEYEKWEAEYKKATRSDKLLVDGQGRKIMA